MRTIGKKRAASGKNRPTGNHWRAVTQAEIDDALAILDGKAIGKQQDRLGRVLGHRSEGFVELIAVACRELVDAQAELPSILPCIVALEMLAGMRGIGDEGDAAQPRNDFADQL